MSKQETLTKKQREWMDQLIGEGSGTVNFGGLSSDEVRAQCAMVTQSVKTHLPAPEMHVIHARFIPTMVDELEGKRRIYFSQDRADAIQSLARWLNPSYPRIEARAMDYVIAKVFVNHSLTEISFRALAHDFGSNHMNYARPFPKIKAQLKELENMAIKRLTPYFEETGLIESSLAEQGCQ